ncbi:hypothetical protein [Nocardioides gilvus]|uniref:hypothetical protein n=1 Tax=Nocardioides gilvus TaxID=1735589 RepID=UPI0013A54B51|nr:hypothetical protein [Nocardioides gilvus]
MTLHVAVMGGNADEPDQHATWGSWGVRGVDDAAELASDGALASPDVREVLVLARQSDLSAARIAGATIAAVRPDVSVRVEAHRVSLGVLVRAMERVTTGPATSNALHASFSATLAATTWGAALPSVTKLARPTPSMYQHVQSWFSGGHGFIAVHGAPGWVARLPVRHLGPGQVLPRMQDVSAGGASLVHECVSFGELPEDAIAALFAMGLGTRPTRRAPVGDALTQWGHERAVEFVITPATAPSPGVPTGICGVCNQPVWGHACPFCRATVQSAPHMARAQGVMK